MYTIFSFRMEVHHNIIHLQLTLSRRRYNINVLVFWVTSEQKSAYITLYWIENQSSVKRPLKFVVASKNNDFDITKNINQMENQEIHISIDKKS